MYTQDDNFSLALASVGTKIPPPRHPGYRKEAGRRRNSFLKHSSLHYRSLRTPLKHYIAYCFLVCGPLAIG